MLMFKEEVGLLIEKYIDIGYIYIGECQEKVIFISNIFEI